MATLQTKPLAIELRPLGWFKTDSRASSWCRCAPDRTVALRSVRHRYGCGIHQAFVIYARKPVEPIVSPS